MNQKELLQTILDFRKQDNTFAKSLTQRSPLLKSSTFDGPPFASGTPHFGHGLTSAMKDTILRYKTMKGYLVNRNRGWDCHGLPVEKAVEKALGIDGKKDIEEKIGIQKFVEACRDYVSTTSDERKQFIENVGRWADIDHAYFTMDIGFMEEVLRAFKNMYDQNLVYKGFAIQGYCPSCATALSNSEINEGYQDRQDPAITIKFKISETPNTLFETTADGCIQIVDCVLKKEEKIFMLYHKKACKYVFPGGKIDAGDSLEKTVKKELQEELGIEVTGHTELGNFKEVMPYGLFNLNLIEVAYTGEPQNLEPEKHTHSVWAEIIPSENKLGFAVKIEETIIDDEYDITHQFYDLYVYHHKIAQQITEAQGNEPANINILAWTTTPWTLPSNTFLAVGKNIEYVMIFDTSAKEYYILAEALLKNYYKNPEEYLIVNTFKGEQLIGRSYEAILPYINNSSISQEYKQQFFKIIAGDFVSTEDGTGIVHIAPSFGQDDFESVAAFLPRADAKNWLFLPVNEYGEFTHEVPEREGTRVYDANKDVIALLKSQNKVVGQKTYDHSYPHCRRCDTPLIYKAMTSRFIKEQELSGITLPNAEKISFVPEGIKNRFREVLKSAPDRNLGRNRYRGSPIPVWESEQNPANRIIIGNLEELYQNTINGSKNITKHVMIRHGETDYNPTNKIDNIGKAVLSEKGKQQAQALVPQLENINFSESILVLSPLQRTLDTIKPRLATHMSPEQLDALQAKYTEIHAQYLSLRENNTLIAHVQDNKINHQIPLTDNIFVDFRICDTIVPEFQDKEIQNFTRAQATDQLMTPLGESIDMSEARSRGYLEDVSARYQGKTIITLAHRDAIILMTKQFTPFDYLTQKHEYNIENATPRMKYRDSARKAPVDLHKPYIDSYWFSLNGETYKRVNEVMDCWFESGAMPFGQAYKIPFEYPADFIIEGLDQTRGRFRSLHVVGNALTKQNSFNNVVVNGMVLAEDGKKMSKKLKNYPDPQAIFERYGSDAYRLYLLSSPAVRAEPVRFSEKGVDQVYKDFTSAIMNAYKFFETYASVDNFMYSNPQVYFTRHALADSNGNLTPEGEASLNTKEKIEQYLRTEADIIITSPLPRAQQTAQIIASHFATHRNKTIEIIVKDGLAEVGNHYATYQEIVAAYPGKNILLVAHLPTIQSLRTVLYENKHIEFKNTELIKLPTVPLINELDKWIISAINDLGIELEKAMDNYQLDTASKHLLSFIDKLNNRYIRRSRRRFRASGMDTDKVSAYTTLFEILQRYLALAAPFAPFVTERLSLEMQKFIAHPKSESSIHLGHLPLSSKQYINETLLEEIATVRRIISLGLVIRAKNKVAIKQPLQTMEISLG